MQLILLQGRDMSPTFSLSNAIHFL